jgi:outer membrane receptor protein involved in Fe transport
MHKFVPELTNRLLPLAAFFIATATFAQAQNSTPAPSSDTDDEKVVLDRYVTVGSRIKNIDQAGPNPVTKFSRTNFETAGFSDAGEALRSLPIVTGASLTPAASNNSFTPGASTVNLRGLGNNNVLVLINGRRSAPLSSPGYNGLLTVFDFNSIPSAAVESIEILKDGGSAIYGSDAVSGVIDIQLRKNFNGVSTTFEIGNTTRKDSFQRGFDIVAGQSKDGTSIVVTFDYSQRNSIKDSDYSFSADANLKARGGPDRRSYAGYPGLVYVKSLDDYYTVAQPTDHPKLSDFEVADLSHGTYNFQSVTDQLPKTKMYGFYSRLSHDFTPYLYAFTEINFRRAVTQIGAAPSPVFNYNEHGDGPNTGYLNIPASNPNNPFGEDLEDEWYARLVHAGNRINDVTSDTPRGVVGLGGKVPETSWTWESGMLFTRNSIKNLNHGSVFDDLYQNALNGINVGGTTLYANPFGPEDPRVTAYYTHDNPESARFNLYAYDLTATGDLFEISPGMVSMAVGGEARDEDFRSIRSPDSRSGNIIGGSEGDSTKGKRTVRAAYSELRIPIIKGMQAQVAARFEHYSDFGSTTNPKYAISYRPTDWLLFRTSYGRSFLAPNLAYLYTSQVTQFSDSSLDDPKRPQDAPRQIMTRSGGNPNLKPEITHTFYWGLQLEPSKGPLSGWSFSVDWFQFRQEQLINQLGPDFILEHEDTLPGSVVRNPPAAGETVGVINYVIDNYRNTDQQRYRGFDLELSYLLKTASVGRFLFTANSTYLSVLNFSGSELAGTYEFPRWRGTFSTEWTLGNWSARVLLTYVGRFDNYGSAKGKVASQTIVNPQVSYMWPYKIKTSLGARNVFDRDPPFDSHSSTGWNSDIHNPEKQFVYLRVEKDF